MASRNELAYGLRTLHRDDLYAALAIVPQIGSAVMGDEFWSAFWLSFWKMFWFSVIGVTILGILVALL